MFRRSLILILCGLTFSCVEKKPVSLSTYQDLPTVKISDIKTNQTFIHVLNSEYFSLFEQDEEATKSLELALKHDPDSNYLKSKLAYQYAKAENIPEAMKLLDEVLTQNPKNLEALFLYARILAVKGDFDQSKAIFLKIMDLDEIKDDEDRRAEVSFILASLYIEKGELSRAEEILKKILAENPEHILSYYYLGRVYSEQNRIKEAASIYQKSVEIDPRFSLGWRALGLIYEYSGEIDEGISAYERVVLLETLNIDARTKLIDLYMKKNEPKKAIEQISIIKKLYPNVPDVSIRLGLFYYHEKMFDQAESEFLEAVQKFKQPGDLYYYLGLTQYQLKKNDLAEKSFSKVSSNAELFAVSQLALSGLYEENKQPDKAHKTLEKALPKSPNSVDLRVGLANSLIRKKQFDEAQKILEDGLALSPKEERYHLSLAEIFERKKQYDLLEKILRSLLIINPDSANALNFLGYSYADRNINLNEAEEMIQKALLLKPNDSYIQDSLAWVYYQKKDYKRAEELVRQALKGIPNEPVILEHLGDILIKQGRKKEAQEIYTQALEHSTEIDKRGQIEEKFKKISN
jgi:tetratricopeptide (TPR) repeat protein